MRTNGTRGTKSRFKNHELALAWVKKHDFSIRGHGMIWGHRTSNNAMLHKWRDLWRQ